jgi:hypothetical protein
MHNATPGHGFSGSPYHVRGIAHAAISNVTLCLPAETLA